jgi:hypothetical protein
MPAVGHLYINIYYMYICRYDTVSQTGWKICTVVEVPKSLGTNLEKYRYRYIYLSLVLTCTDLRSSTSGSGSILSASMGLALGFGGFRVSMQGFRVRA